MELPASIIGDHLVPEDVELLRFVAVTRRPSNLELRSPVTPRIRRAARTFTHTCAPTRPHGGRGVARKAARKRKTAGRWWWGGQDLNLRPTDYESVPAGSVTCGGDHKSAPDRRLFYPTARMTSGRFPVRRGADAGRIVAISDENEFVAISFEMSPGSRGDRSAASSPCSRRETSGKSSSTTIS